MLLTQHCHVAVGSRVKYLVDTSELLWGCLDTQDYLAAAHRYMCPSLPLIALVTRECALLVRACTLLGYNTAYGIVSTPLTSVTVCRFLRASEVHRLLVSTASASMTRFPLLRHQWPSIQALK